METATWQQILTPIDLDLLDAASDGILAGIGRDEEM